MHTKVGKSNYKGFTIIEIMIVLVIVVLIILLVLLTLPTLRRVERNNYRKRQASYAASQMDFYKNDNRKYPETATERCNFIENYYASGVTVTGCNNDASKNCVLASIQRMDVCFHGYDGAHTYLGDADELSIEFGHWCNRGSHTGPANEYIVSASASHDRSKYAIWVDLENAPVYCVDNAPN